MPHTKSAKKRMRTSEKSRVRNKAANSLIKTTRRSLTEALAAKDAAAAGKAYAAFCAAADKAAKKGILPRNTAIRKKARAAAQVRALKAAPAAAAPSA